LVKKTAHLYLHHRVAQKALRLWCVSSICCGALHHVKKTIIATLGRKRKSPEVESHKSKAFPREVAPTKNIGDLLRLLMSGFFQRQ
jgi:hypothetical protein